MSNVLKNSPNLNYWLHRLFPFMSWIGEVRDAKVLHADVLAGITVALVLVPQSMAYAQLAGLPAYFGLYAAFLPPMVGALFGSSRQMATGPVAMVSILTAAALEPLATAGGSGYVAYAIMLSLLVGLFQLAVGLLRLGAIVSFLSHPVIVGFTNAAAIIIATSQLDKIFGVRAVKAEHHYETVWSTLVAIPVQIHLPTFFISAGAFAIMLVLRRINPRLPNVLIAVAITTLVSYFSGYERLQTVTQTQFVNPLVQEVIADQIKLKQEISQLDQVIVKAEKKYRDAVEQYGVTDTNSLAAKLSYDSLKLKRERRSKTAKLDLDEIKAQRFQYSPGTDAATSRIYDVGHVPAGIATDGRLWRVRSIDGDRLVLNGGGNVVGDIPEGLPSLVLPKFDFGVILQLLSTAITIALIGFVEAISIAKAMATKTRHSLSANQELIGQGLANIAGSLTQSYPTSGSFSRSAVNFSAGAVTGFSSVVTSIIVIVTLLWLTPLLYHLPQATLAAVIMVAVVGLINVKAVRHAWQAQRQDGIVAITTFALTLAFAPHMDKGILAGAALALMLYLYRTMQPRVAVLARYSDGTLRDAEALGLDLCENISMIRFDGQLYFANTVHFESKVMERVAIRPDLKYVIVVGDGINQIDATGEETLAHLADRLKVAGISLLFTGLKKQTLEVLQRTGLYDHIGAESFFRTEDQALDFVWKKLGNNHEVDCPLNIVCPITPPK